MMHRRRPAEFASLRQIGNGGRFDGEARLRAGALAVFEAWRKATGPRLARVTRPVEWTGGRLVVEVSDPIWLRHLERMTASLVPEVNAVLSISPEGARPPRVSRVILRPGSS